MHASRNEGPVRLNHEPALLKSSRKRMARILRDGGLEVSVSVSGRKDSGEVRGAIDLYFMVRAL